MTEKIIKFPDIASRVWKETEEYYDTRGGLNGEDKEYIKRTIRETIQKYDGWDFEVSFNFQDLNIKDRESFVRSLEENVDKQLHKNLSNLFSKLVGEIIGLKVIIYRLRNGLE